MLFDIFLLIGIKIYIIWFSINKCLVEFLKKYVSDAAGAIFGMLFLEAHTICKVIWYTLIKYRNKPIIYGLDHLKDTDVSKSHLPVLLLPGAVGTWPYLGDLAIFLKNANIPVFVIDLDVSQPSERMRQQVLKKIREIRELYSDSKQLNNIPLVNIVAHSNGGNIALYAAFTEECSSIDENGMLSFQTEPKANPCIGKIITLALPSNSIETSWMQQIGKLNQLYNINAEFDALMGHKTCHLANEISSHVEYINAGHIGIVYKTSTYDRVVQYLKQ